jgi:hypothetical protein
MVAVGRLLVSDEAEAAEAAEANASTRPNTSSNTNILRPSVIDSKEPEHPLHTELLVYLSRVPALDATMLAHKLHLEDMHWAQIVELAKDDDDWIELCEEVLEDVCEEGRDNLRRATQIVSALDAFVENCGGIAAFNEDPRPPILSAVMTTSMTHRELLNATKSKEQWKELKERLKKAGLKVGHMTKFQKWGAAVQDEDLT